MTRDECERKCREVIEGYEGNYFRRFPEFHCIEYALVDNPGTGKRNSRVLVSLYDSSLKSGVMGSVDLDYEHQSINEDAWNYGGNGHPCDSYEDVIERLKKMLGESECRKKTKPIQMTLFDFM